MMNDFTKRFYNSLHNDGIPISKMIFEMSVIKSDPSYKYFCIVEGRSDVLFYDNINVTPFREKRTAFIYKDYSTNDNVVGKSAVVRAYLIFCKLFSKEIQRCIFIVDHDYDGLDCEKHGLPEAAKDFINVLPVYSYENYFLSKANMHVVFLKTNITSQIENRITKLLMDVKSETIDYFSCKCVITIKSQITRYKKLRKIELTFKETDLFRLSIGKEPHVYISTIKSETEKMKNRIDEFPELTEYYELVRRNLISDDENRLVKGKVLFCLLRDYLFQITGSDISQSNKDMFSKIVSELELDFIPVFAKHYEGATI